MLFQAKHVDTIKNIKVSIAMCKELNSFHCNIIKSSELFLNSEF